MIQTCISATLLCIQMYIEEVIPESLCCNGQLTIIYNFNTTEWALVSNSGNHHCFPALEGPKHSYEAFFTPH